jgi:predicted protein tyrosine phosphatase
MKRVLFICSRNQWRSPTAEQVFAGWEEIEVASARISADAVEPVTPELLQWADLIGSAFGAGHQRAQDGHAT